MAIRWLSKKYFFVLAVIFLPTDLSQSFSITVANAIHLLDQDQGRHYTQVTTNLAPHEAGYRLINTKLLQRIRGGTSIQCAATCFVKYPDCSAFYSCTGSNGTGSDGNNMTCSILSGDSAGNSVVMGADCKYFRRSDAGGKGTTAAAAAAVANVRSTIRTIGPLPSVNPTVTDQQYNVPTDMPGKMMASPRTFSDGSNTEVHVDLLGWIEIQHRVTPFDRPHTGHSMDDFKYGFSVRDSYWLGLNWIRMLVENTSHELMVVLRSGSQKPQAQLTTRWIRYRNFSIDSEESDFKLRLEPDIDAMSTLPNSLHGHDNVAFTLPTSDQVDLCGDPYVPGGGWWLGDLCAKALSNLNANTRPFWDGAESQIMETGMFIRPLS